MRYLLKNLLTKALSIVFIFSLFGCQTENIEEPNPIFLVNQAVHYLKSNDLINESELRISGSFYGTIDTKTLKSNLKLKYKLISIGEAFENNYNNCLHFRIIDSKSMEFFVTDKVGNHTRYFLEYETETNTYLITKVERGSYIKRNLESRLQIISTK
jgi:hypothetical protein